MEFSKKIVVGIILVFIVGIGTGYYFGSNAQSSKVIEIRNTAKERANTDLDADKKNLTLQKLDLLKNYTDFIFLPPEATGNSLNYVEEMEKRVKSINDEKITAKFYTTGETENKEQKIIEFLDFLNESIKADLSQ